MSVLSRRPWLARSMALSLGLILAGCDQPTGSTRPRVRGTTSEVVRQPAPEPAPAPPPESKPREILGKTTQDIRDMEKEKKAGGVAASPKIVSKDPIRITGNAYVSIVGQAATLNIKHAVDLYQATTGEYPKTTEEFMEKIIKENNIALPKLPFYQEYTYDASTHSLVVMEYPERKKAAGYPE